MVTDAPNGNLARWQEVFDNLMGRVAGRFARVEPRPPDEEVGAWTAVRPAAQEPLDHRR